MNTERWLLTRVVEAMQELDISVQWRATPAADFSADGLVDITVGDQTATRTFHIKTQIRPSTLGLLRWEGTHLLITDHVSAPLARQLRDRGIDYMDASGNASLRDPNLLVLIDGRRARTTKTRPVTQSLLFGRAPMSVVLAVLSKPALLDATIREVQAHTVVSIGTVQKVLAALQAAGYRRPLNGNSTHSEREHWRRLFDGWVASYAGGAREKLRIGTYVATTPIAQLVAGELRAVVSGEAAAEASGQPLRATTLDFYVHDEPDELVRAARLRADPQGNIVVRRPLWTRLAEGDLKRTETVTVAPEPVVYADLIAVGDPRTDNAARRWLSDAPNLRLLKP